MAAADLRARALRLLTLREHSRLELARKLGQVRAGEDAPDPAAVDALLDQLQAQGWLDEARFAASLVRRRGAKYGALRLARELRSHALDPALAAGALAAALPDVEAEVEAALQALRRRHPEPACDARARARQQRFLAARGFSSEAQRLALRRHGTRADDDAAAAD